MKETLEKYINDFNRELFYKLENFDQVTLGEVRGKYTILYNHESFQEFGLDYDQCDKQGFWEMSMGDMYHKWELIKAQVQNALNGEDGKCYLNYLSGAKLVTPGFVASGEIDGTRQVTGTLAPTDEMAEFPRDKCPLVESDCVFYEGMNVMTRNHFRELVGNLPEPKKRSVGVIFADFIGTSLIKYIVLMNIAIPGVECESGIDLKTTDQSFVQICKRLKE